MGKDLALAQWGGRNPEATFNSLNQALQETKHGAGEGVNWSLTNPLAKTPEAMYNNFVGKIEPASSAKVADWAATMLNVSRIHSAFQSTLLVMKDFGTAWSSAEPAQSAAGTLVPALLCSPRRRSALGDSTALPKVRD